MSNFYIGLSGLQVSQAAIETIGTNITNAATDGYHRQAARISPLPLDYLNKQTSSGGAEITDIVRQMDFLLENEIIRQHPDTGQNEQELTTIRTLEAAMGDLDEEGVGVAINSFFNSLHELAAQPNSQAHLEQVVWSGEAMSSLFRNMSQFITGLKDNILLEAQDVTTQMNNLMGKIGDYNMKIHGVTVVGGNTNLLKDQRDAAIEELAGLIQVTTHQQGIETGMLNVEAWGIPVVVRAQVTELEIDRVGDGSIGVSVKQADHYDTRVTGGKVGALLNLYNEVIPAIEEKFNALAGSIIERVNELHVQGVGREGSFTELTGWRSSQETFDQWASGVEDGDLYVRVIDQATGDVERHLAITVDADVHDIDDIVAALDAIPNLNAANNNDALHVYADNGYKFDFLPAISTIPDVDNITGTSSATFAGAYSGEEAETYSFHVEGGGEVGESANLYLRVEDSAGQVVAKLNVGEGYPTGDLLDFAEGLKVSLDAGTLNAGDSFELEALATSDASGALAALGINTFFSGSTASDIQVVDRLIDKPTLVAASISPEMTDNKNLTRMAQLGDARHDDLDQLSINDYYRRLLTDIGHEVATREARKEALNTVRKQMINNRDMISGVDVNEEAAKLIMFENMFQAISKFIVTQNKALQDLMQLI
jgi:flagellar hook-associated protein 1 FlgK